MIIYRAFSFWNFFVSFFARIGCVAFLIYLYFSYTENPPLIIAVGVIGLALLIFIGNGVITVYNDRVTYSNDSISSFFIKPKVYPISEIKDAYMPAKPAPSAPELGIAAVSLFFLYAALPKPRGRNPKLDGFIELKNGKKMQLMNSFSLKTQQEIVNAINECIRKKH